MGALLPGIRRSFSVIHTSDMSTIDIEFLELVSDEILFVLVSTNVSEGHQITEESPGDRIRKSYPPRDVNIARGFQLLDSFQDPEHSAH
jgi:hypothetical protein